MTASEARIHAACASVVADAEAASDAAVAVVAWAAQHLDAGPSPFTLGASALAERCLPLVPELRRAR